ncbi:MAG: hypothetical protein AAFN09_08195 [Pseudomonadota bacterium]
MVILLLLPVGCVQLDPAGVMRADITGIDAALSRQAVVSRHPHHTIIGQAVILERGGTQVHVVEFGQTRDGVHGRLRMDAFYQAQRELAFVSPGRAEPFCHGTRCDALRVGEIHLTPREFATASRTGLRGHLVGPDGAIEVTVPADLFAVALQSADMPG